MQLFINLLYHGNRIDSRQFTTKRRGLAGETIEVEIGSLIDIRTKAAVLQAIDEPPHPTSLDASPKTA